MPLGRQSFPQSDGTPQIVPIGPNQVAPAPPGLDERAVGGVGISHHETLVDADFNNGIAVVRFPGAVTAISVYAPAGVPLYLAYERTPGSTKGSYDLYHPGTGILSEPTRPITELHVNTGTGGPPGSAIEVHGYGGSFALRAL